MTREILFRGKRLDNGEWVEGFYYEWRSKEKPGLVEAAIHSIDMCNGKKVKDDQHPVDPATVGQYTGLKDKNGRRIFDGDTFDYNESFPEDDPCPAVVSWRDFGWGKRYIGDKNGAIFNLEKFDIEHLHITGNIHDKPEGGEDE